MACCSVILLLVPTGNAYSKLAETQNQICIFRKYGILVGYAQTAVVGIVLLTGSTVYTELS